MKRFIAITFAALALFFIWACEENPAQEYGRALTGSMKRADRTADRANLGALKKSIAAYYTMNGRYPGSLDEVAQPMGLDPSRFDYDPATGKVTLKSEP
jgi:hypothetical protein